MSRPIERLTAEEWAAARELAEFARWLEHEHPESLNPSMVREGLGEGYPPCCVTFFAATIPLRWKGEPAADLYWDGPAKRAELGYVPCPRCLLSRLRAGASA